MSDIAGLILAGGQARRLGGAGKSNLVLGGQTLLERTVARLEPQCASLILSLPPSERAPNAHFAIVRDTLGNFEGPLSGLLAGLDWIADHAPEIKSILTVPVDSPFLPLDLCRQLEAALTGKGDIAVAKSGDQTHPLHAIWPTTLRRQLHEYLCGTSRRKVTTFQEQFRVCYAHWNCSDVDPFFNINTPDDLALAKSLIASPSHET